MRQAAGAIAMINLGRIQGVATRPPELDDEPLALNRDPSRPWLALSGLYVVGADAGEGHSAPHPDAEG